MASPLGGVMMAIDMLEIKTQDEANQQAMQILQESVEKMRVMLTLWRTIFTLNLDPLEEEATFLSSFQAYMKAYKADITVLMARSAAPVWQVRLAGIMLLSLNDRLGFLRNGKLSFDHGKLVFQADFDKGNLFDRMCKGNETYDSLPITRQALPNYLHHYAQENNIHISMNDVSPFQIKMIMGNH